MKVPAGSPSRDGDATIYVFDINQPSLPTLFHSVLGSVSVFMALSAVSRSINSPDNSPLSHSVLLLVLFLAYRSFQLHHLFMKVSLSPNVILCGWLGLKHQLTNLLSTKQIISFKVNKLQNTCTLWWVHTTAKSAFVWMKVPWMRQTNSLVWFHSFLWATSTN